MVTARLRREEKVNSLFFCFCHFFFFLSIEGENEVAQIRQIALILAYVRVEIEEKNRISTYILVIRMGGNEKRTISLLMRDALLPHSKEEVRSVDCKLNLRI